MYNLEVQSAHTFFVGQNGWLTHNCSLPKFTQPGWIKKDLYSELSNLDKRGKLPQGALSKMEEALKDFTSGQGGTGIKKLTNRKYELKILGEGGGIRLYGSRNSKGQVIFDSWSRSH